MSKIVFVCILVIFLASCSSLEQKYQKLEVGASRADVSRIMGPAPYKFTYEGVDAWRYAVIGGFGYCDYREFYIYRDVLIYKNEYNRASIAGCTVGLKNIDWEPILIASNEYDTKNPVKKLKSNSSNIVEQLTELNRLKEAGAITEEEFVKAKQALLNNKI